MALRSTSTLGFARRALCAGIAASFGLTVMAEPSGLVPVHGSASIGRDGKVTTVTTVNGAGGRSVLDWSGFGVGQGESVRFQQPDAASTSINRVLGGNPSAIAGTLWSNGRLVLVNPAGIAVGAGAVVDTAGFTASTLGISRDNAIAGRLLFGAGDLGEFRHNDGSLQVQGDGRILASGGDVVLIGRDIATGSKALLQATGGDVVLAAGRTVEVTGRGLEGIRMQLRAPDDGAVNLGTLRGDSVAIFAGHLHHSGLVQARSAITVGGKVVLQATDKAEIEGRILATTAAKGGSVQLTADKLKLKSETVIDVSHAAGGGEILVGGGLDGRDPRIANARDVEVDKGVLLRADATLRGDGGTVVAWSNGEMDFRGRILARGAGGGAGGLVEVSARGRIRFEGGVDVNGDGAKGGPAPDNDSGPGRSGDSGGPRDSGGPGSSGSGRGGGSDAGGDGGGSSGPTRGRVPIIPIAGQSTEVRSGAVGTASETADYLGKGSQLRDPSEDDFISLSQPAGSSADSDARVLGAGPQGGKGKRGKGGVVLTDAQCRAGS
ncbi:filamentous hemagglutinin N-terminal domain-containing protein [Ramlibacter sp. AN1133]|uniref:filamentous hemagglutinin N-terminal domain-containing protein n=1 Tax=Ramlibacter sp. AN1133 TaxID=3133429 RepID=UPI0030BEC2FA